jgi:hypothetical protein
MPTLSFQIHSVSLLGGQVYEDVAKIFKQQLNQPIFVDPTFDPNILRKKERSE